jgi:D-alanyl-D-alanine carboxypeptidase/D-alanyl-D-alanine-endopeptidase (penicillin-binding protein 4)
VAGVDGTLSRRFKGTAAEGRARMKTGTLRDVVALAGFVPDSTGKTWIVVAIVNDDQAAKARPAIDALVDWVARR